MSACNCCEQFPIEAPLLQVRSRNANAAFCGFYNDADGKFYYKAEQTFEDPWAIIEDPGALTEGTFVRTLTKSYDATEDVCNETRTFEPNIYDDEQQMFIPPYDDSSTFNYPIGGPEYSEEEAPSAIKERVLNLLGEYSEWSQLGLLPVPAAEGFHWGPVFAVVETTGRITEAEMRLNHYPTATGYLKVWLTVRTFTWDLEEAGWTNPIDSEFAVYEWTGEPASDQHAVDAPQNRITSQVWQIACADDQKKDVYIAKYSLIPGYEPEDPLDFNAALSLNRPDPDCESNGVPTLNEDCPFRP